MAYSTRSDVEEIFGKTNIKKWADMDNDDVTTDIEARITAAILYADAEINDRLRGGPYTLPFTSVPTTIIRLSATMAAVWLHDLRGNEDETDQMEGHRKRVQTMLSQILSRGLRLNATEVDDQGIPEVVS